MVKSCHFLTIATLVNVSFLGRENKNALMSVDKRCWLMPKTLKKNSSQAVVGKTASY